MILRWGGCPELFEGGQWITKSSCKREADGLSQAERLKDVCSWGGWRQGQELQKEGTSRN